MKRNVFSAIFLSLVITPVFAQNKDQALDQLIDKLSQSENAVFQSEIRKTKSDEFKSWPKRIYIDPDIDFATITTRPGVTWEDCKKNSSLCVGWPDGQSQLERIDTEPVMERDELDLGTGEVGTSQYMKVKYKYSRTYKREDGSEGEADQKGEGWIDVSVLRKEELKPIYSVPKVVTPSEKRKKIEPCPPLPPKRDNVTDVKSVAQSLHKSPQEELDSATEALRPFVGQCSLRPPTEKKLDRWQGKNIYDTEALPLLQGQKEKLPKLSKLAPDGKSMVDASFEDIVAVDTLARTIYSEMNGCFKEGLQYPMAAAKVAINRSNLADDGKAPAHFTGGPQAKGKPVISKVLTAPYQFSVWNYIGAKNPRDKTVLMSLCPTRDNSNVNWKGSPATPADKYAWNYALKIASEAVLFKDRFMKKTSQINQLYYTSKMTKYDGRSRPAVAPIVEGRKVDSFACMYVWNGK